MDITNDPPSEGVMKVFLSSTYVDLIEHRKAAHTKNGMEK